MERIKFKAENFKKHTLVFIIPAVILLLVSISLIFVEMSNLDKILLITIFLVVSSILIIVAIYLIMQPKIAIETNRNSITFYKRKKPFTFDLNKINKVQINVNFGSFDTTIYTSDGKRKSFHFLIIDSNQKKEEYIGYFEYRKIKVVTVSLNPTGKKLLKTANFKMIWVAN